VATPSPTGRTKPSRSTTATWGLSVANAARPVTSPTPTPAPACSTTNCCLACGPTSRADVGSNTRSPRDSTEAARQDEKGKERLNTKYTKYTKKGRERVRWIPDSARSAARDAIAHGGTESIETEAFRGSSFRVFRVFRVRLFFSSIP